MRSTTRTYGSPDGEITQTPSMRDLRLLAAPYTGSLTTAGLGSIVFGGLASTHLPAWMVLALPLLGIVAMVAIHLINKHFELCNLREATKAESIRLIFGQGTSVKGSFRLPDESSLELGWSTRSAEGRGSPVKPRPHTEASQLSMRLERRNGRGRPGRARDGLRSRPVDGQASP